MEHPEQEIGETSGGLKLASARGSACSCSSREKTASVPCLCLQNDAAHILKFKFPGSSEHKTQQLSAWQHDGIIVYITHNPFNVNLSMKKLQVSLANPKIRTI